LFSLLIDRDQAFGQWPLGKKRPEADIFREGRPAAEKKSRVGLLRRAGSGPSELFRVLLDPWIGMKRETSSPF
jgi:hypothetical protein